MVKGILIGNETYLNIKRLIEYSVACVYNRLKGAVFGRYFSR